LFSACISLIFAIDDFDMRFFSHPLFWILTALLTGTESIAQQMSYRYELPSKKVSAIVQDKVGWIWIGTDNGLCRFNGNGFLVFTAAPEEGALENDEISCLFTDTDGTIWFGNECGIGHSHFGQFVAPEKPLYNQVHSFASVDTAGVIMAEKHSLLKMSDDFRILQRYISPHLLHPEIVSIPAKREVWVYNYDTTEEKGEMIILDNNLQERLRFAAQKPVTKMVSNPSGNVIWALGPEGMSAFNLQTYSPQAIPPELTAIEEGLLFIDSYNGHDLLLGRKDGLFRYDSYSGTVKEIDRSMKFQSGMDYVSFVDRDLNVWLYGEDIGLRFVPSVTFRTRIQDVSGFLSEETLTSLSPDAGGGIWAVSTSGLNRYSLTSRDLVYHKDGSFKDMCMDSSGHLWLTGYDRSLNRFSIKGDSAVLDIKTNLREVPRSIAADNEGRVWIAYSNQIQVLDGGKLSEPFGLGKAVRTLKLFHSPASGRLFLISSEGISTLDLKEGAFQPTPILDSVKFPTCMEETEDGKIWIGTISEGLLCYDGASGEIKKWDVFSGMTDDHVKFLEKDQEGNIWAVTKGSIVRLDVKRNVFNYIQENHLFETQEVLSCCMASDGCLYYGGAKGMYRIHPSDIVESTVKTDDIPIYLDYLKVNGRRRTDLLPAVPLELTYREDMVNLGFSGMKYGYGPFLSYQYMLEGYDSGWKPAFANNDISYSNLPAGKYTFRARVKNLNGEWSKKELSVPFIIKPAVWATWWAKLIYALLFLSLAAYCIRLLIKWRLRDERLSLAERDKQLQQDHIDFLVNVSHELRTPLTLIAAPLKQLQGSPSLSAQDRSLVNTIGRSSVKLEELAEQIMNVGKSTLSSEPPLKVSEGSLPSVVKGIADNFRFIAMDKELHVEVQADETMQDGYFDTEKVERVLYNLISNAVKYTPAGGDPVRIRVASYRDIQGMPMASVSVEDCGAGIPPERREELFKRFDRLDAERFSPEIKGAGVGLNYAQYIASKHHGFIAYSDNVPHGSIFTFSIPYSKESYAEEEIVIRKKTLDTDMEAEKAVSPELAQGSILLVEDNEDVRAYLRQLLSQNYNVTTAVDGLDGWDCLKAGAVPDLVISDVIMPRKDGFELCRDIKGDPDYALLPVLLLTAKSDLDNHVRGLNSGADAYVPKPFDPYLLLHQVKNLIEGRREMQRRLASLTSATIGAIKQESAPNPGENGGKAEESLSEYDRKFLERLYKSLDEHLDDQEFNVSQLASELFMSYSRFYVRIKMLTGETPLALLNTYRMNVAMEHLKTGKYTVGEVSEMVGASSLANFSRSFKRQFGYPPSQVEVTR